MDSLLQVLDQNELPLLVQIKSDCILNGVMVLRSEQRLTVIDRHFVNLLYGQECNGDAFKINIEDDSCTSIEVVDEYHPETVEEVVSLSKAVSYLLVKTKFGYESTICEAGDIFTYVEELKEEDGAIERKISFIRHSNDTIVNLPVEILMNTSLFAFVSVKNKLKLTEVTEEMLPLKVRFVQSSAISTHCIVELEDLRMYDVVVSVTLPEAEIIRYEIFPLDARIKAETCQNIALPKHIEKLGHKTSSIYEKKMEEVKFLIHHDIYTKRYYGSLEIENQYSFTDSHLVTKSSKPERPASISTTPATSPIQFPNTIVTSPIQSPNTKDIPQNPTNRSNRLYASLRAVSKRFGRSDKVKLWRTQSDSQMAMGLVTTETGIQNENKIFQIQQKLYDTYKIQRKSVISEPIDEVEQSSSLDSHHFKKNKSMNQENPLYGFDTPTLNELRLLKSKSLDNSKETQDIHSPTSNFSNSPQEEMFIQHASGPSDYDVPKSAKEATSPIGDYDDHSDSEILLQQEEQQNLLPPAECDDSGIDSPLTRNSLDNIYKMFEQRNAMRPSEIINHRPQQDVTSYKKRPPVKPKQISQPFEAFTTAGLSNIFRSNSEPLLDQLGIIEEDQDQEKRRSLGNADKLEEEHIYADIIYEQVKGPPTFCHDEQRREIESMNEIKAKNIEEVGRLLNKLGLSRYIPKFEKDMVNGTLLYQLDENDTKSLGLTKFEARKLHKYIHGWRPSQHDVDTKKADVRSWSINNIRLELKAINVTNLSVFCAENHVDGALLCDLIQHDYILSLTDHGIRLTPVELKKIKSYLSGELEYDKEDIKRTRSLEHHSDL